MVDSPSPPPNDHRSSRSRSPSSSSRSSAVRNGTSHHSQSSHNSSKEYSGSRPKGYSKESSKIVQVANIAPQATREQMQALFGYVGKIDDIRLYPTVDIGLQLQSKICFVKFYDTTSVGSAQHLTNTVFIDRVLIVIPFSDGKFTIFSLNAESLITIPKFCDLKSNENFLFQGDIPDETRALELLASGSLLPGIADPKLPQHVTSQLEGIPPLQVVITKDPRLLEGNLPLYPPLPPTVDSRKIEEIRRTIMICNIDPDVSAQDVMDYFSRAGEVKYFRFCTRDNDPLKFALIEFSEQPAILDALSFNGQTLGHKVIRVYHATQAIIKPQAKTNEAAQKEIEEAMSRQAQNLLTHGLDTTALIIGFLKTVAPSVKEKRRSRSRSRSHSRRSRSRGRRRSRSRSRRRSRSRSRRSSSRHRDRYRSKTKRSRSRSRDKRRSRSRKRSRSRGHSRKSRSRSHSKRSRSRSKKREEKKKSKKDKDRDKDREKDRHKEKDHKENGVRLSLNHDESDGPNHKEKKSKSDRRSRSPKLESKKRRRSRTRSHSRKRSSPGHEKKRSKSKKKKKDTSDREPSVDSVGHSRSSSQEKRSKKESSGDLEYDDKSDISRSHGDIDDGSLIAA
ncbi:putative splicing factor, arginine/serine-rich 7 [Orchesella cincta]|uniref:Putative splicing factor, arginine/serine-rich 7 n=1 Tax=Orchesella cincta TaxID=48709 RepID=A0A1D2NMT6_ORCCI|nr:putative splicing factor, arginine/serine-rich 7 [Orchesella cincta]